ncbi:MAG: DUF402 domain-containing protein [Gemmatimonadales bacterium]|nr:DUF402 domain-containing protein [Gemmatimonadales bacterium]NIN12882.1 DUF402 domain-containing protein [Gemmatimonadales bacterium]NIR00169.1 DUF402 domain-containing protein [Gemmatimonadales bacterium]NIS65962.1 DUF402 domain-containing protein [Gemmatimonadales bacterium]
MAPRIRYQYRRPGRDVTTYDEFLVLDRPDVKVLLQETYGSRELRAGETIIHEAGAPMVWYVFPARWHDIARFHLLDGRFSGWYTNLTTPVEMKDDVWSATDLFLDLWQPVMGDPQWLDEDEFEQACRAGWIDSATRRRVLNERAIIDLQVRQDAWPPPITKDIDLDQARALKQG